MVESLSLKKILLNILLKNHLVRNMQRCGTSTEVIDSVLEEECCIVAIVLDNEPRHQDSNRCSVTKLSG